MLECYQNYKVGYIDVKDKYGLPSSPPSTPEAMGFLGDMPEVSLAKAIEEDAAPSADLGGATDGLAPLLSLTALTDSLAAGGAWEVDRGVSIPSLPRVEL